MKARAFRRAAAAALLATLGGAPRTAVADTYPRQPGVDVLHYSFRLTLSDATDVIEGEATVTARFVAGVSELSLDLAQPRSTDLNFAGVPGFTLDEEGGRVFFGSPTAIDPASGSVSGATTRRAPAYAQVLERRNDLRGYGGQLTVSAATDILERSLRAWPYLAPDENFHGDGNDDQHYTERNEPV